MTEINELTNYTSSTTASAIAPLTYINEIDDEGLQEQFLMEDEAPSEEEEGVNVTANRVVTPQGMQDSQRPLNPIYMQQTQGELDTQPSRGPRNTESSLGEVIGTYLDDNYEDVLRMLQIKTSFSIVSVNNCFATQPIMPLEWVVPDGTNRLLEEIQEKKIASGISTGRGSGAVIACLPTLEGEFTTKYFLIDLDTGEVFAYIDQLWRCTRLYCSTQAFNRSELWVKIERNGRPKWKTSNKH